MLSDIGRMLLLLKQSLASLSQAWRQRARVFEQLFEIGNASLFMACLLSLFVGGVLALQTGPVMSERGVTNYIGGMVGLAMCKELGPVMMAILISGRIGSSITAEIGSMKVYQEIDALRTMNINPVHFLVMPRLLAIMVALPLLVVFSTLIGWMGGAMVPAIIYDRSKLLAGDVIPGPAIVIEMDSTTLIEADCTGTVDSVGNILITLK